MNDTLKAMKRALENYYTAAKIAKKTIEDNETALDGKQLDFENARVRDDLLKARKKAEEAIASAGLTAKERVKKWSDPDGAKVSADARLLDYGVSVDDFEALKEKHKDNSTMLRVLKAYADRENEKRGKFVYNAEDIPTAEAKYNAVDYFARSAVGIMDAIDGKRGTMLNLGSPLTERAVASFGEENAVNTSHMNQLL